MMSLQSMAQEVQSSKAEPSHSTRAVSSEHSTSVSIAQLAQMSTDGAHNEVSRQSLLSGQGPRGVAGHHPALLGLFAPVDVLEKAVDLSTHRPFRLGGSMIENGETTLTEDPPRGGSELPRTLGPASSGRRKSAVT